MTKDTTKPTEEKKTIKETKEVKPSKEDKTLTYYEAVGRRKTSTSRVRLYVVKDEAVTVGTVHIPKGAIVVNGKPVESYFVGEVFKKMYSEPFRTTNTMNRFCVSAKVTGGGLYGQLGAFIHATSRALIKVDAEKFRPILKKRGFLTRDPRARERRKPNHGGKARAGRQSPKR